MYYVYFYLRTDGTPYYVGKGTGIRAYKHCKNDIIHTPKDSSKILIYHDNLTEMWAFILERYYIRWFGRKDIGTGILRNRTDGGEGFTGTKSEKHKNNISKSLKGKTKTKEHRHNISKSMTGRVPTGGFKGQSHKDISRSKISNSLIGKTKGMITVKDYQGNKLKVYKNDPRFINGELVPINFGNSVHYPNVTCNKCNKSGKGPNMTRYHFDNCKSF